MKLATLGKRAEPGAKQESLYANDQMGSLSKAKIRISRKKNAD